jgi:uncharacterized protein YkwD
MKCDSAVKVILVVAAIILFSSGLQAQKTKPGPAPKPTPKAAATKQQPGPTKTAAAEPAARLAGLENEVLAEINNLRKNPASYIGYLEQMKSNFKGNLVVLSDGTKLITSEGQPVVDDAIAFLKNVKPLTAFKLSPGLTRSSADHLLDLIGKNITGHKGSDGSWPPNRVDRYGFWSLEVKENISYRAQSARDIVLNMLIDDGNPKRDHRKNLLSSNLRFIGLSAGEGKSYGRLCVLVFAGEYSEKRLAK